MNKQVMKIIIIITTFCIRTRMHLTGLKVSNVDLEVSLYWEWESIQHGIHRINGAHTKTKTDTLFYLTIKMKHLVAL